MKCPKILIVAFFTLLLCQQTLQYESIQSDATDNIIHVDGTSSCKREFVSQTFGIISSPYYPLGYPDNTDCKWKIKMEEGTRIVVSLRSFALGPGDRLVVNELDGSSTYGLANPPNDVLFSSSNELMIELKVDKTNSSNQVLTELRKNRTFYAVFEKEGCGGLLTQPSGHITVPSYIHLTQKSHECSWTILAPSSQVINLQFLQFDLPPGSCLYNNIYIREGDKTAGYVLGDFCEENPPFNEIRSSSNIVYISYRSRPNFLTLKADMLPMIKIFYKNTEACGGELGGYSGSFIAPRRWLENVYSCNWTVSVPHEKQISLKFNEWQAKNFTENDYDELNIIASNDNSVVWSSRGNNHGNEVIPHSIQSPPSNIVIPSNKITISLLSSRNKTSTVKIKFHGVYQAINADLKQCIDVGYKKLFMCDEWNFIDCSLTCDAKPDCENARDEINCPITALRKSIIAPAHHEKPHEANYSAILLLAIAGVLMIVAIVMGILHRLYKKPEHSRHRSIKPSPSNAHKRLQLQNINPPPYAEFEGCEDDRLESPPPPYSLSNGEHSEDINGIGEPLDVRNFEVIDTSCDITTENTSIDAFSDICTGGRSENIKNYAFPSTTEYQVETFQKYVPKLFDFNSEEKLKCDVVTNDLDGVIYRSDDYVTGLKSHDKIKKQHRNIR